LEEPVGLADEIDDAQAFIANLKTPDRHIALISQIPCSVNRAVYDRKIWFEASFEVASFHFLTKIGADDRRCRVIRIRRSIARRPYPCALRSAPGRTGASFWMRAGAGCRNPGRFALPR